MTPIRKPSIQYVRDCIDEFDNDGLYDAAVRKVFQLWPTNVDLAEILIKVVVLNRLYSTNVYDVYSMAKHIEGLNIDERLRQGDPSLIADIAKCSLGGKNRNCYSFASKYCAWQNPDAFQMFDSRVERVLCLCRKQFAFADFKNDDLYDYSRFLNIIEQLRIHFDLLGFSRKELDKFLWIAGESLLEGDQ